ncbi:probable transcription factor At1g11510 [Impatiens glandulifera]|uniref:probable transcription factor At1g11510 n=1 Tax=Impatiens glandulifera TaxID=253017 RepID=UPI001FB18F10|nr:probable transcription factor At1g11510 [Impatiens glandulifera]
MAAHTRRKAAEAEKESRERSSSDEEDSDSESEGNMNNRPPPKKLVTSLPHKSTDDYEDASDSDNDLQSNPIPKSVPEVNLVSTKKPNGESSSHAGKNTRSSKKRPAESSPLNKGNDSKKSKKKKKNEQEQEQDADENVECENMENKVDDAKKQLFQRIWSEEDEIAILNGMIDHGENEGINPATVDMSSLYDSIRDSIQVQASRSQLTDKVKKLKKKFLTNLEKSYNGIDRTFAKDHDQKCYDLSKKIWGTTAGKVTLNAKVSRNRKGKNAVEAKAKKSNLEEKKSVPTDMEVDRAAVAPSNVEPFCIGSFLEKKIEEYASELITGERKLELDSVFRQLQVEEAQVYLHRLDYMRRKTILLLEALGSNTN